LVEAAKVFDSVYGFESHGVTSWRTKKLVSAEPKIQVFHLKAVDRAAEMLAKADLVFCNSVSLAEQVWPLTRTGAFLCTEDELEDRETLWKGKQMHLYKKD
jgi:hypothetical protein